MAGRCGLDARPVAVSGIVLSACENQITLLTGFAVRLLLTLEAVSWYMVYYRATMRSLTKVRHC